MTATTLKVSSETRDKVMELVGSKGKTADEVVVFLLAQYEESPKRREL